MNERRSTRGVAWPRRSRHDVRRDERGDTLIEVLITLIVMSITAASVLFAFSGSIAGSATHRNLVTNDVALRTVAQSVYAEVQQQANPIYTTCATYYGTQQASQQFNAPSGFTTAVTKVSYYYAPPKGTYGWQSTAPSDCTTPVPQELTIVLNPSQGSQLSTTIVVNGSSSSSPQFQITSITPSSAPPNTTGQYIVITGTGFQSGIVGSFPLGSGITFTGGGSTSPASSPQPSSWTLNSATSITAQIDVANVTPGPVTFTLTNPDGKKATSTFTIAAGPTITAVNNSASPTQLYVGTSNVTFDLTGTGFQNGATLSFTSTSGVSSPGWTVVSPTSITSTVDVSSLAPPGTYQVTVTNPDGLVSNPFPFVVSDPAPIITKVNNGDSGTVCHIKFNGDSGKFAPRISAHDSNVNCTVYGANFYRPLTYVIAWVSGNNCVPSSSLTWVSTTQLTIKFTNTCGNTWSNQSASTYSLTVTTSGSGGMSTTYSPAFSVLGNG